MDDGTFLKKITPYGKTVNPFAVLCQCHHETKVTGRAWSSELFLKTNNAAGIKAWSKWTGELYEKVSWEQSALGSIFDKKSPFCKYPTIDDFISNYVLKIKLMYPLCVQRNNNFLGYFNGLLAGQYKWATDKLYFTRLIETSIELAPIIFGKGTIWRQKYLNALEYAIQERLITEEQQRIVEALLKTKHADVQKIDKIDPVPRKHICIDFGHGGSDAGASFERVFEKDRNRAIGEALGRGFSKLGFQVSYTRTSDEYVSLSERADRANKGNADILLSIHCNSAKPNPSPSGFELWTTKGVSSSDRLATDIYNSWIKKIGGKVRTDMSDNDPDKEENWTVLYRAKMPSVLLEMGFLSNQTDRMNLQSIAWISSAVDAIIEGVQTFLSREGNR